MNAPLYKNYKIALIVINEMVNNFGGFNEAFEKNKYKCCVLLKYLLMSNFDI